MLITVNFLGHLIYLEIGTEMGGEINKDLNFVFVDSVLNSSELHVV